MKKIKELFPSISSELLIKELHNDSRLVDQDSLFIAYTGFEVDVHDYINSAYDNGCRAFFVSDDRVSAFQSKYPDALFIPSDDLKLDSARLILSFYDNPDRELCLIGITGTNGKTTTATLINQSLRLLGNKTAFFGTVEWSVGDEVYPALNTTPDFLNLIKYFKQAVEMGVSHVVMEVASHALSLGRVEFLNFDYAMFTNLSQDHLDFHESMEDYYLAKSKLFFELLAQSSKKRRKAIVNGDDPYAQRLLKRIGGTGIPSESLSLEGIGSWNAEDISLSVNETTFTMVSPEEQISIKSPLLGMINVQNLMMAIVLLKELKYTNQQILSVVNEVSIAGRLQKVISPNGAVFLVDYAHTPDALQKAIDVVNAVCDKNTIVVFGAGGDRDTTKRPLMAKASLGGDIVVVTSDNPRTEDPNLIVEDVLKGFDSLDGIHVEVDRRKALALAYELSSEGDVILVAGKGHEDYQIIGKTKHHFSDVEEIQKLFEAL